MHRKALLMNCPRRITATLLCAWHPPALLRSAVTGSRCVSGAPATGRHPPWPAARHWAAAAPQRPGPGLSWQAKLATERRVEGATQ